MSDPIGGSQTNKENKTLEIEPFNSVNLYNLFCEILDIQPNPKTNGSTKAIEHLLLNDGIEWYTLGKISFEDDWTFQKIFGMFCMLGGILVGVYAVCCVKEEDLDDLEMKNGGHRLEVTDGLQKETLLGRSRSTSTEDDRDDRKPMPGVANKSFEESEFT